MLKRKEEEDQQMRNLVQTLQAALEKEKIKVKELTEQVGNCYCTLIVFIPCRYIASGLTVIFARSLICLESYLIASN